MGLGLPLRRAGCFQQQLRPSQDGDGSEQEPHPARAAHASCAAATYASASASASASAAHVRCSSARIQHLSSTRGGTCGGFIGSALRNNMTASRPPLRVCALLRCERAAGGLASQAMAGWTKGREPRRGLR
jgi:hypothetical protein